MLGSYDGTCFFPICHPSVPKFLSLLFQGICWYDQYEILKSLKKCSYLQKYNTHCQQKNFSYLVCTKYIFYLAICQLRHRNSGINKHNLNQRFACIQDYHVTLLKVQIGTFYMHARQKIFINAISSNSEKKFIKSC